MSGTVANRAPVRGLGKPLPSWTESWFQEEKVSSLNQRGRVHSVAALPRSVARPGESRKEWLRVASDGLPDRGEEGLRKRPEEKWVGRSLTTCA